MGNSIPYDEVEETGSRGVFLRLRNAAGLPSGGEIVLKEEVVKIADAVGISFDPNWPRRRIVYHMLRRCQGHEPDWENYRGGLHGNISTRMAKTLLCCIEDGLPPIEDDSPRDGPSYGPDDWKYGGIRTNYGMTKEEANEVAAEIRDHPETRRVSTVVSGGWAVGFELVAGGYYIKCKIHHYPGQEEFYGDDLP